MPFGIKNSGAKAPLKFSKKKTYTVQEHNASAHHGAGEEKFPKGGGGPVVSRSRRNTAPAGILKRGGHKPVSYLPALEDGMVPQEMAAAIPMPKEMELNALFAEMVVSFLIVFSVVRCSTVQTQQTESYSSMSDKNSLFSVSSCAAPTPLH